MLPRFENKLHDIQFMITTLLQHIVNANNITLEAYINHDYDGFEKVKSELKSVGNDANTIDNEIIKAFALYGPEAEELRMLISFLKMTNELVRMGEGVKKYARRMRSHCESECDLATVDSIIVQLHKSSINALAYITTCFENFETCDVEEVHRKVMVEESKNDDLFSILEKEILTSIMSSGPLSVEYVRILGTLRKLERTCDRAVNVANLLLYAKHGGNIHIY
ncbi:MAG TPA: PhoU family transcriptional regulator [Helicobacteraceae bacterium]|nr:PhoU family transcriptional regulator [Helicobacteraceae bacterium]